MGKHHTRGMQSIAPRHIRLRGREDWREIVTRVMLTRFMDSPCAEPRMQAALDEDFLFLLYDVARTMRTRADQRARGHE